VHKRTIYISLLLIYLFSSNTIAQVGENEIKSIYLIKIINDFEWEENSDPFEITIISKNNLFYKTLYDYSKTLTVNGRAIIVKYKMRRSQKIESDVIYYGEDKNEDLIKNISFKKGVLVFTNNLKDIKKSMINFHLSFDQKLRFKVNKQSLRSAGFNPSTIILILGGSNNDVLAILEEKDISLAAEKKKSSSLKKKIAKKESELNNLQKEFATIEYDLSVQKKALDLKNSKIQLINNRLLNQQEKFQQISSRVLDAKKSYEIDLIKLEEQKEKSFLLKEQFQLTNKIFNDQKFKIDEQEIILKNQNNLLKGKEKNLKYAFFFSAVLLVILFFAIIFYIDKRRSNKDLAIKNKKIKDALDQLQITQTKLIQSEKMASLGMVTAGIAHEINNPMTFIFTGASILKEELKNEASEITETINDIIMGAERVSEIIESLQNFSRLDESNVKKINLHENINSTLVILGSHARNKEAIINTYFDDKVKDIECFPASINQVIANIVANAIDAITETNGVINIKTNLENGKYLIKIEDNGKGISVNDKAKIFDPFFTTKEVGKGTGLGLSISYNIVKKHNGNINVISELSKGSTFIIELPIRHNA
jgi:signal transduction histidine kinase